MWYLSKKTKADLDILLSDVKDSDMDLVIVIDGKEGSGKSFTGRGLAMYCATVLNTTFDVNDIYFDTSDYIRGCLKAKPYEVSKKRKINLLDEGRKALGRGKVNNPKVDFFLDFISECRDLGQVHIVLLPAFHDLKRYIVLWRQNILIHMMLDYDKNKETFSGYKLKRGQFKTFTDNMALREHYDHGYYGYPKFWSDWNWWSNKEVFTDEALKEYLKKKREFTILKYGDGEGKRVATPKEVEVAVRRTVARKMRADGLTNRKIANYFGVDYTTISKDIGDKVVLNSLGVKGDVVGKDLKNLGSTVEP